MASAPFCTCKDHACPLNPHNHDKGCTLCVEKCLKLGEIPSCFFKLVDEDISGHADFTLGGFVRFYETHSKKEG